MRCAGWYAISYLFMFATLSAESKPLRIQSHKTLTCHQDQGTCSAEGNVEITQGDFCLCANRVDTKLTRDQLSKKKKIASLTAFGKVRLSLPDLYGKGDKATYTESSGHLILKNNASLHVHDVQILSQVPFTFNRKTNKGWTENAHVIFPKQKATFLCKTLRFFFKDKTSVKQGKRPFQIIACNVLFATETGTIQADHAVYDTNTETLTLTSNVHIVHPLHVAYADQAAYHLQKQELSFAPSSSKKIKGMLQTKKNINTVLPKG